MAKTIKIRTYLLALLLTFFAGNAMAVVSFNNKYYSPRNKERPVRKSTTLIVLHTTEASSASALPKLSANGECNYCIDEKGQVYRIIDRSREAFHAGRSMWNGKSNVDEFSVGIEVCGYHNKPLSMAQYRSLAELIGELKYIYKIPDHCVISHSHVAYGTPNKWFKRSHRGRKRCGMMFALPAVRRLLNLKTRPASDPDVKAGRLIVGDTYLSGVLYGKNGQKVEVAKAAQPQSTAKPEPKKQTAAKTPTPAKPVSKPQPQPSPAAIAAQEVKDAAAPEDGNTITKGHGAWDIARAAYNDENTIYIFPNGSKKRGTQIVDFKAIPVGTKVIVNSSDENLPDTWQTIGVNGDARDIAGDEALSFKTIYVYPDGHYFRGSQLTASSLLKLPYNTKVLMGYSVGGPVTPKRSAHDICGVRWKAKDTFYLVRNILLPGDKVEQGKIPSGTIVFYKS